MLEKNKIFESLEKLPPELAAYSVRQWNEATLVLNSGMDSIALEEARAKMQHELKKQSWKVKTTLLLSSGEIKVNARIIDYL